jgi:2-iminobutanoate/2-iminopropanoate deaminase
MRKWIRMNARELPEFPAFAHAATAGGTIWVSGMLGLDDDFSAVVPGGVGPETTQAFRHVETILKACGASLSDVVKVSVYMTDLGAWEAMNEAYIGVFGEKTPARIAVGCAGLLFGASVEFDCVAYR